MFDKSQTTIFLNGRWRVTSGPVSPDPGPDDDPARSTGEPGASPPAEPPPAEPPPGGSQSGGGSQPAPDDPLGAGWRELRPSAQDWLTEEEWVAWLASMRDEDPGLAPGEEPGPEDPPPPARKRRSPRPGQGSRAPAGVPRAVPPARRGPGERGSARRVPGDSPGPAGAFAAGQLLDVAPGGGALHGLAEHAAGPGDRFAGASDDELTGLICALDRAEASACSLKHAAVAELIRRRPEPGCPPEGPAQMPGTYDEFTEAELTDALAETRCGAAAILSLAHDLEVKLPGTRAAFRAGVLRHSKAEIIARATADLDPAEARAAEALVLDRAGRLTPGGLRAAIARAVIQVAPGKAVKRREEARRNARVQRWLEDSGNAALMGRELPPADVLAADQRITWWAKQLKKAGLDGDMDQLRALAYMDIMLGRDSRPAVPPARTGTAGTAPAARTARPAAASPAAASPAAASPAAASPAAASPAGTPGTAGRTVRAAAGPGIPAADLKIPAAGPRVPAAADRRRRTPASRGSRRRRACSRPGSPAASTSPSRWPPCWAWPPGPARSPGWARSTRPWLVTWPARPP